MTPVKTERKGAVLLVTLDRPKANAIDLHRRFAHEFRAWLLLRSRKNLAEKLINTRRDLIAELTDIVKFYVASVDHTDTPD